MVKGSEIEPYQNIKQPLKKRRDKPPVTFGS
jgi:hypothetical protein